MAASAHFLNKYGVARHIYIAITKRSAVDFAVGADWTPAAGDVKISKDGGAAQNVTNLPSAIAMGNAAIWDFSLTATEMQAAQVIVTVTDAATKAVEDAIFMIETYGNASAQHAVDLADSVRAGLTALPNAAAGANGGLPTGNASGQVTVGSYASGQAPLQPTVAGRTLDVSATGEGGVDWANVGSPTTVVGLTGTTIKDVATPTALAAGVWDVAMAEPTSAPAATGTFRAAVAWLFHLTRWRIVQTSAAQTVRNSTDTADVASAAVSDDGFQFVRGKFQ